MSELEPYRETWRRLHPLTPLLNLFRGGYLVILLIAFSGPWLGDGTGAPIWGLALVAAGLVLMSYLRYRYQVTEEGIFIEEGILFRRRRAIPRSRIQHIDLKAGLLQQILGVVQARIETAGGMEAEAALNFVSREEGSRLRGALVEGEAALGPADGAYGERPPFYEPKASFTKHVGVAQLAIAGATSNRAGVLFGILFGGNAIFDFMPTDWIWRRFIPEEYLESDAAVQALAESAQADLKGFIIALTLISLAFAIMGWGVAIAMSVVRFFEFTLAAGAEDVRVRYGLLTRRETSFRINRVQNIQVEEPVLRRWLGLASLRVQTAGYGASVKSEEKMEVLTPIARRSEIPDYLAAVFPSLDFANLDWQPSHPRALRRLFYRRALVVIWVTMAAALALSSLWGFVALAGLIPAYAMARLHYRHLGHARVGSFLLTREGFWTRRTYIVPVRKIQAIHLKETPFQRRLGLGTVTIETAGSPYEWHAPRTIDVGKDYGLEMVESLAGEVRKTGLNF